MENLNIKGNTLFIGDNLYILKSLNNKCVNLIYLDPPFNSKRLYKAPIDSKAAGVAFKDMWSWQDVDEGCLKILFDDYPNLVRYIATIKDSHSKAMMAYITYMTQRIIEMYRVLKDTGSLYLHCDSTASHYLKLVLDNIFASSLTFKHGFKNEIIWRRIKAGKDSQHKPSSWGRNTDTILFYTKTNDFTLNPYRSLTEEEINKKFDKVDKVSHRYFDDSAHIFRPPGLGPRPNLCYEWKGFTNPHSSGWTMTKERLEEEYQKGNFVIRENGKLERRKYLRDYKGYPCGNFWDDIPAVSGNEDTGFPTQKPLSLMYRIIGASCNEGDVVLDPFCGCATTLVAAEKMKRKWIGIDLSDIAGDLIADRLRDDSGLFSNFVRRVIDHNSLKSSLPERTDIPANEDIRNPDVKKIIKERLFKENEETCKLCKKKKYIEDFDIDHVVPSSRGGAYELKNYQILCRHCNTRKGNRPMELMLQKYHEEEAERLKNTFYG